MKLSSAIAATMFIAASMSNASAADKATPEILNNVQGDSVEMLSENDEANTRGERITLHLKKTRCIGVFCFTAGTRTVSKTIKKTVWGRTFYVTH